MKNKDIHQGLPHQVIRDFLGRTIVESWRTEASIKRSVQPWDEDDPFGSSILRVKEQIKELQAQLEILETRKACSVLMKLYKWDEWDVSDDTERPSPNVSWMSFIGTKEEYDFLMTKIHGA